MNKPHFTFWVAAAAGLLWNLAGCMNFIMQTNPETVEQMPDVYQLVINGRPAWATAAFMVAVFGGAVGCILLLLRRSEAVLILLVSLLGVLGTAFFTVKVVGFVASLAMSVLVAGALYWYAILARRFGWLH